MARSTSPAPPRGKTGDIQTADLRAFVAVIEHTSFSRAGTALGISQPTVSIRLQNLEEFLGLRLIDRRKGVVLTEMGRSLYNRARQLLTQMDGFEASARELRELESGNLRLGFSTPPFALELMGRFRNAHPQVQVSLTQSNTWGLIDQLKQSDIDVAVMTMVDAPPEDLSTVRLAHQRIAAMVPASHRLARRGKTTWAELSCAPLVVRKPPSVTYTQIEAETSAHDATLDVFLSLPSREAVKEAVAAGLGIGLAFGSEIGEDSRIKGVEITDAATNCAVYVATLNDIRGLPAVAALMSVAREMAGTHRL